MYCVEYIEGSERTSVPEDSGVDKRNGVDEETDTEGFPDEK